jgi:hypothetical protein
VGPRERLDTLVKRKVFAPVGNCKPSQLATSVLLRNSIGPTTQNFITSDVSAATILLLVTMCVSQVQATHKHEVILQHSVALRRSDFAFRFYVAYVQHLTR